MVKDFLMHDYLKVVDEHSSIETLGGVLYTSQFSVFLLTGIILLLSMVGAISLTLQEKKKKEMVSRQVARKSGNAFVVFSGQLKPSRVSKDTQTPPISCT